MGKKYAGGRPKSAAPSSAADRLESSRVQKSDNAKTKSQRQDAKRKQERHDQKDAAAAALANQTQPAAPLAPPAIPLPPPGPPIFLVPVPPPAPPALAPFFAQAPTAAALRKRESRKRKAQPVSEPDSGEEGEEESEEPAFVSTRTHSRHVKMVYDNIDRFISSASSPAFKDAIQRDERRGGRFTRILNESHKEQGEQGMLDGIKAVASSLKPSNLRGTTAGRQANQTLATAAVAGMPNESNASIQRLTGLSKGAVANAANAAMAGSTGAPPASLAARVITQIVRPGGSRLSDDTIRIVRRFVLDSPNIVVNGNANSMKSIKHVITHGHHLFVIQGNETLDAAQKLRNKADDLKIDIEDFRRA